MSLEIQKRLCAAKMTHHGSIPSEAKSGTSGDKAAVAEGAKLRFKPRSRESLHTTLFFAGETLVALPPKILMAWHERVSEQLASHGFGAHRQPRTEDFSVVVTGLRIFPPQRNNLVVAMLEVSPAWQELHHQLWKISQDTTELADLTHHSHGKWVAHITLGNVFGGSKKENKALNPLMQDIFENLVSNVTSDAVLVATTRGIGIGGPVPKQVSLNWDFPLS